ncbi:hypothetical protein IV203_025830 [Nitzschia inconspicua]|uniref:Uncharacterized protein n=1 Tax=Nitzschia inconspicua TaxID=303405 RepID=A0A9K3PA07_9STRA|nr:hypothetical protein IV203_017678 [Nitzschia inconspicua]KAG7362164.1 hypothetical protein IV203_025830 [Nitzschia inconspicua]
MTGYPIDTRDRKRGKDRCPVVTKASMIICCLLLVGSSLTLATLGTVEAVTAETEYDYEQQRKGTENSILRQYNDAPWYASSTTERRYERRLKSGKSNPSEASGAESSASTTNSNNVRSSKSVKGSTTSSGKSTKSPTTNSKATKSSKGDILSPVGFDSTAPVTALSPVPTIVSTPASTPAPTPVPTEPPRDPAPVASPAASPVADTVAAVTIDIDGSSILRQRELKVSRDLEQEVTGILEVKISYSLGNGNQVTQTATVTMRASETTYSVHFENIPTLETITATAIGPRGGMGTTSFLSRRNSEISIILQGIGDVSPVVNFHFFEGSTEGWTLLGPKDSFSVIPHVENLSSSNVFKRDAGGDDPETFRYLLDSNETDIDDFDLVVSSNKYEAGEVSASYTFEAFESEVLIRYRFVADVLANDGSVGKGRDDYYHLSIRSSSGTSAPRFTETKSILGLGTNAFDLVTGSTPWMYATVSNVTGVTEVRGAVGKVGKSRYQSHLVIDYVEEV